MLSVSNHVPNTTQYNKILAYGVGACTLDHVFLDNGALNNGQWGLEQWTLVPFNLVAINLSAFGLWGFVTSKLPYLILS